ncbi:MAG: multiheme c-type cytochrome [bacterium]
MRSIATGVARAAVLAALAATAAPAPARAELDADNTACVECHTKTSAALVREWEHSRHATNEVGCYDCHRAAESEPDAWKHHGAWISTLVTPRDCAGCHEKEQAEFESSHHAKAGEILASLDNVLAEKACGMPGNIADAVNGCWQCHGSIVKFKKDASGKTLRTGPENKPVLDADTWPNSGMGRLNPDGSKGSCHACHSRHDFNAKLARSPENCGKCHMGPDHPQIEIFNESKHGIAFAANRERMALDKEGDWILGRDYSAAPTCATCHMSGYVTADGTVAGNSHDVGERISWTLRPIVSTKLNLVVFEDGFKEDYPDTRPLPKVGDTVTTQEKYVENDVMKSRDVPRKVARVRMWDDRRNEMKQMCASCHATTHVDNFYEQFDDLVVLYNDKFAKPAKAMMDSLHADGVLNPRSPFGTNLQWTFYELWHHEGRRARHGASMMGPDYTHWHGMYEVAKHFYAKFLPEVVETAEAKSEAMGEKYAARVAELLEGDSHLWLKGLTAQEVDALKKEYQSRYQQKQ